MNGYEPGIRRHWPSVLALVSLLALWVGYEPGVRTVLRAAFPTADTLLYDRTPMWRFLGEHLGLVAAGGAISLGLGVAAGLVLVSPVGRPFRGVVMKLAGFGQAVPSVALMAMAVPAVGYGSTPVLIALVVFSVLPVMVNVIAGIDAVPAEVVEAGRGIGMTRAERLWQLEVPLALPVIMAGVRTMLVILVSAATLGAVVGAGGLGVPIMSGIGSFNNAVIAHGAVPAILLALIIDRTL